MPTEPLANPFDEAIRDFNFLKERLATAQRERDEAANLNTTMAAEIDATKKVIADRDRTIEDLSTVCEERDRKIQMLQAHSAALTTRLDVIVEIIGTAKREAMEQASRLGIIARPTDAETPEERKDGESVNDLIGRLSLDMGLTTEQEPIEIKPQEIVGGRRGQHRQNDHHVEV